jgi:glycosyltransferase involved in cell wall biosynthesis
MTAAKPLPSVSVILAVKNGADYLAAALETVLAQTHPPLEVLVIDDESEDETRAIAEGFAAAGVRFIANFPPLGIAGSRNLGVTLARGELLAFTSHDDLWDREKLRVQSEFLRDHPEVAFCIAHVRCFVEQGKEAPRGFPMERIGVPVPGYLIETLVARRSAFELVGPFDTTLKQADDTDWYARAQDLRVTHAVLPDCLVQKRLHTTNTTYRPANAGRLQRELLEVVRRAVARKHASAQPPK